MRFEAEAGGSSRKESEIDLGWQQGCQGSRKCWKVYLREFCVCKMYALKTSKGDVTFICGEGRKALVIQ